MAIELKNLLDDWKGQNVHKAFRRGYKKAVKRLKVEDPELFDNCTAALNLDIQTFRQGYLFGDKMAKTIRRAPIDSHWGGDEAVKNLILDASGLSSFVGDELKQKYFDRMPEGLMDSAMEAAEVFPEGFDLALGMVMFISNCIREDIVNAITEDGECQLDMPKKLTELCDVDEEYKFADELKLNLERAINEIEKENPKMVRLLTAYYNIVPYIVKMAFDFGTEMACRTRIAPIERVAGSKEKFLERLWEAEGMSTLVEKECMPMVFKCIKEEDLNEVIDAAEIFPNGFYPALNIVKLIGEIISDELFAEIDRREEEALVRNYHGRKVSSKKLCH